MFFFKKPKPEEILEEIRASQRFLIETTDTQYMFYIVGKNFYVRKTLSKDRRYGLVTSLNGKEKYSSKDLELGAEIEYIHPRLGKVESGGKIKSIEVH